MTILRGPTGGIAAATGRTAVVIPGGETGPVHVRLGAKSPTKVHRGRGEDHLVKQHDLIRLELPCTKPIPMALERPSISIMEP
jgi:hypothetical protein